jgi:hypothetical protein
MPSTLRGAPELRRRLKAIKTVFKPAGREWADSTAEIARGMVPVRTGKLRGSIRRRNASQKRATVVGHYAANFVDAGVKAHDITAKKTQALKFSDGRGPVFRRKVHKQRIPARPFKKRAADEGLKRTDIIGDLIELWNRAA